MIVIPAVDIKDGKCVRLYQGDYGKVTVYGEDPTAMAQMWCDKGARLLHIVDLDGAKAGEPRNTESIVRIASAATCAIEVGGGLRRLESIERLLGLGVERVVLGTAAVEDRQLVREACTRWGSRIIVGIDARNGLVATKGWTETTSVLAVALARELATEGVQRFIYTDISRDGALSGPNYDAFEQMVQSTAAKIVASGGVSKREQLPRLAATGVEAVIIGRALYTGDVHIEEIQEYLG